MFPRISLTEIPLGSFSKPVGLRWKPTGFNAKPGSTHKQPARLHNKPIGFGEKPVGICYKPIGSSNKPTGLRQKPIGSYPGKTLRQHISAGLRYGKNDNALCKSVFWKVSVIFFSFTSLKKRFSRPFQEFSEKSGGKIQIVQMRESVPLCLCCNQRVT